LYSQSAQVSLWLMMSHWDALRMNMITPYQELVRTCPRAVANKRMYIKVIVILLVLILLVFNSFKVSK
ncbi:hypothetical protein, partial [Klebsiella pneumoniae]|uniref:hypothetical protein n=1 Tax=Klebsiella pneumoniae TaxID=573 RepID=UPI0025A21C4F